MTIKELLEQAQKFEVDKYNLSRNFKESHVAFTGTPEKHPYAEDKIILIVDPFSANILYYEFTTADIAGVEELPNLVTMEGESVKICRVWVRKGSIAIRSAPFIVEDTTHR